jgi:hypothetical protein
MTHSCLFDELNFKKWTAPPVGTIPFTCNALNVPRYALVSGTPSRAFQNVAAGNGLKNKIRILTKGPASLAR